MRKNYEMSQDDLDTILNACKPVPYMIIGGQAPRSQQEYANAAWGCLGRKMGFDYLSVEPSAGRGPRFFSALPLNLEVAEQHNGQADNLKAT